jgi:hypothetical protein
VVTINDVRSALVLDIGQELTNVGFSFKKSLPGFQRISAGKEKITIIFDWYDFMPVNIEFKLLVSFGIPQVHAEMKKYYEFCKLDYTSKGNVLHFCEGDFHPNIKFLTHKERHAATHVVTDLVTLQDSVADCRKVLINDIIPKFPSYSTLEGFQSLILDDYSFVIHAGFTIPALIAIKLKSKTQLQELTDYIWKELNLETKPEGHLLKTLVGNIVAFASI